MSNAKNEFRDPQAVEREMRRFLNDDPIPELTKSEIEMLTGNVLRGKHIERKLRWYDLRPAFKVALGAAAILVVVFSTILVKPNVHMIQVVDNVYDEAIFEQYGVENVLVAAIAAGDVDEEEAFSSLIGVDASELESAYESYRNVDIDSEIDDLTEEEARRVIDLLDKLGYPDKEGV